VVDAERRAKRVTDGWAGLARRSPRHFQRAVVTRIDYAVLTHFHHYADHNIAGSTTVGPDPDRGR